MFVRALKRSRNLPSREEEKEGEEEKEKEGGEGRWKVRTVHVTATSVTKSE